MNHERQPPRCAPVKTLSKQRQWQLMHITAGRCRQCAKPPLAEGSEMCHACREKHRKDCRERARRKRESAARKSENA